MTVRKVWDGKTQNGQSVARYTLRNQNGMKVDVLSLGGIITSIRVPDKHGSLTDVVLGYDTVSEYENDMLYFGALIGPVANRISKARFSLEGNTYELPVNNGPNHLHGGTVGFHKKVWSTEIVGDKLRLSCASADGEEGYPGEVSVCVTYDLTDDNELAIDYSATTTKATPINLTNHSYFNLAGHGSGNVYDHTVRVCADSFTPKTDDGIPTGEIENVANTMFDLRQPVRLGDRIHEIPGDIGYDHNFCLESKANKPSLAAVLEHQASRRVLEVYTTQPGLQLYTSNYVNDVVGKGGVIYPRHSAVCLETQNYPDAINQSNFPSCVLHPGQVYSQTTIYKFLTK